MAGKTYDGATVEVKDGIDPSIKAKLAAIRMEALQGADAVDRLQKALNTVGSNATNKLQQAVLNTTAAQERLAAAQAKTQAANAAAATSQQRLATETQKTATASQKLATEQAKTATAVQKTATELNRTAKAASDAQAASDRAALAALRLQRAKEQAGKSIQTAGDKLLGYAKAAAAAAGAGYGAVAIVKTADAYVTLQNKLGTVATSQAQVNELTERMFQLSNRTMTPIEANVQSFTRFDRALKNMGKSQEESLRMTETINKALALGGATTQEAAAATLQLSQAFNSGRLQGDEFRSVSENMPSVLDAVAKVLNKPISQIKALGSEGKITSEVMFKAFKLMEQQVDTAFAKLTPTVDRALVIAKNNFVRWIGEINNATGFTTKLAQAIIWLSNNFDMIGKVVTIAGAAMLTAFGPNILAAITAVGTRIAGLYALILANPWVALATVIVGAATALTLFSDRIAVSADGFVTLKDAAGVVFDWIRDAVSTAADWIKDKWNSAIDWINDKTDGWGEQFRDVGALILNIAKGTVNFVIGGWVGAYQGIKAIWNNFPGLMEEFFVSVVNSAAAQVERLVNAWQVGARAISGMLANIAPESAKALNGFLDKTKVAIPRMQASTKGAASTNVSDAFFGAFGKDYVGDAATAFMDAARKRASGRRADELRRGEIASRNAGGSTLRGTGPNIVGNYDKGAADKAQKAAESREKILAKINAQMDNEIARMNTLKPLREDQQKIDAVDEQLIGRKLAVLTGPEKTAMMEKIKRIREMTEVQQQMDRIYEESVQPQRDYNATVKAASDLLARGVIDQKKYNGEMAAAELALKKAKDPLFEMNKALDENIKLSRLNADQREVEAQVLNAINTALEKKTVLTDTEIAQLRERIRLSQEETKLAQERDRFRNSFSGAEQMTQFNRSVNAMGQAGQGDNTFNQAGAVESILQTMGIDTTGMQVQLQNVLAQQQNFYQQLKTLRDQNLISANDASMAEFQFRQKVQDMQLSGATTFFGYLSQLQTSQNKKMAAIGKAAAIAQTVIDTYKSAQSAYAALAGIPYIGPALGIAAAAAAVAAGMARVSAIRSQGSFMHGGFTGSGQRDQVAGVTHANEFVMNAKATAENRPMLEAMNAGVKAANANGGAGGGNVAIVNIDFNYDIDINGGGGSGSESDQSMLLQAVDMANKKTQSDIQDSLRYGGTWAMLIRQVAKG